MLNRSVSFRVLFVIGLVLIDGISSMAAPTNKNYIRKFKYNRVNTNAIRSINNRYNICRRRVHIRAKAILTLYHRLKLIKDSDPLKADYYFRLAQLFSDKAAELRCLASLLDEKYIFRKNSRDKDDLKREGASHEALEEKQKFEVIRYLLRHADSKIH